MVAHVDAPETVEQPVARVGSEKLPASRSRHAIVRSQARSTTSTFESSRSAARASAAPGPSK